MPEDQALRFQGRGMVVTLGSNIASLAAQRKLGESSQRLSTVYERLSSGQRINRSSDDAAGLAIARSLNTDGRVFSQAIRNLNDGLSLLNVADGALAELSDVVVRIQELAEQSANGTYSNTQRASLDNEAQALRSEFFRIARSTEFNGMNLFDGSLGQGLRLQAGFGTDGSIQASIGGAVSDGTFSPAQTFALGTSPSNIQIADMNGDGELDVLATSFSADRLYLTFGNGDGTFSGVTSYSAGNGPSNVDAGDLNNDGVLDVGISTHYDDNIRILLGNGDGTLTYSTSFYAGDSANEINFLDFNGDGILDILNSDTLGDAIRIHLGNGDGTFATSQSFAAGNQMDGLATGDIDNDGHHDVVTANRFTGGEAHVLFGNGDGTFQPRVAYSLSSNPKDVELADINGDSSLDFIAAKGDGSIAVMLNDGSGNFGAATDYAAGSFTISIAVGDVNSDGIADVTAANRDSDDVSVFINNGDGSFQNPASYSVGDAPDTIRMGDFNGDDVLDVVVSNTGSSDMSVLLGNTSDGVGPLQAFSLASRQDALAALAPMKARIAQLSEQRGQIGSFQSRIQVALNSLTARKENAAAAESRIMDADIALESGNLARLQILQQSAAAMFSQANQLPQLALSLLQ